MYEGHFQLRRRPFAATPDPICHYLSPTQVPLLQSVARCIDLGQGVAIATGPAGIGKTLLAQVLLAESESRFAGVYLGTGQFPTRRALLQAVLYELGQAYGGMTDQELRLELNTALRNLITQRDGLLLVLDEAHLLSDRLLEEVRLLADLSQYGVPLTRVVLVGNPEFEERLTSPALAAFNQRVACHIVLEQFTRAESIEYLNHRIRWAGGSDSLFDYEALELIANASDGLPRCLNQLADNSLSQAYLNGQTTVTAELVRQSLAELQHLPLRWNATVLQQRSRGAISPPIHSLPSDEPAARSIDTKDLSQADDENSVCCFEFGAGDSEIDRDQTASKSSVIASTEEPAEFATYPVTAQPPARGDEEDADCPPLFSWLGTAEKELSSEKDVIPAAPSETADFSTSSFTIHARRAKRVPQIEQEVVSTVTLSGADLQSRRNQPAIRATSTSRTREITWADDLPAEEIVVDAYAALDARLAPVFPRSASAIGDTPLVRPSMEEVHPGVTAAATDAKNDTAVIRETEATLEQIRPEPTRGLLERLDALSELLENVDAPFISSGGVELITEYGVERIDVDLSSDSAAPLTPNPADLDSTTPENWIGSTVVEIGRELQQAMQETSPRMVDRARAAKIDQLLDSIEREIEFDVVEPEARGESHHRHIDPPATNDSADEDQSRVVPRPNHSYKNFFSVLRRRQSR